MQRGRSANDWRVECFVLSTKRRANEHWTENFFLRNRHGRCDAGEQGRGKVETATGHHASRLPARCALGAALLHKARDALQLNFGNDSTDVGGLVERIANV